MNRQEEQLDRLVDVITKRVEAELEKRARPAAPVDKVAQCGSCDARKSCEPKKVLTAINAGAIRLGASPGVEAAPCSHVAPLIDHTILKPEATREELRQVAEEARQYGFATVCVNSANVRFVASILEGSSTKAIAVVGFPTGAATTSAKAFETREAIRAGAQEIDRDKRPPGADQALPLLGFDAVGFDDQQFVADHRIYFLRRDNRAGDFGDEHGQLPS